MFLLGCLTKSWLFLERKHHQSALNFCGFNTISVNTRHVCVLYSCPGPICRWFVCLFLVYIMNGSHQNYQYSGLVQKQGVPHACIPPTGKYPIKFILPCWQPPPIYIHLSTFSPDIRLNPDYHVVGKRLVFLAPWLPSQRRHRSEGSAKELYWDYGPKIKCLKIPFGYD